jgi:hypothetical protein
LQKIRGVRISPFDLFEKVGHGFGLWDIECGFSWAFHLGVSSINNKFFGGNWKVLSRTTMSLI